LIWLLLIILIITVISSIITYKNKKEVEKVNKEIDILKDKYKNDLD